jgi:hypothetical protein
VYYAFDLLWLDGEDLRNIPLAKRKARLEKLIPETSGCIGYVKHWNKRGKALFEAVKLHDLEGIVAKKKNSLYEPGTNTVRSQLKPPYSFFFVGQNSRIVMILDSFFTQDWINICAALKV